MQQYFLSQRDAVFSNVKVLVYVFSAISQSMEKDLTHFKSTL